MYNWNGILFLNNWHTSYNKNNENYATKELPNLVVHLKITKPNQNENQKPTFEFHHRSTELETNLTEPGL